MERVDTIPGLSAVAEAIEPGCRIVVLRRLRGGISSQMHVLTVRTATGARRRLVLRRYLARSGDGQDTAHQEWRLLKELCDSPITAPEPLWADFDGTMLGQPAIVTGFLPGKPLVAPSELEPWTRQLAETLAAIHALPVKRFDFLPTWDIGHDRWISKPDLTEQELGEVGIDGRRVVASLSKGAATSLSSSSPTLLHWDYWPGNTLWTRRRLTGVVDWAVASIGDFRYDVAYCRMDMSLFFGAEAAGLFTRGYQDASGKVLEDMPWWDLFASLRTLPDVGAWGAPYEDLGKKDVPGSLVIGRLREFVARALREGR